MNTQLLWDGLKAMILGMGMVYFFLIIMIWIMNLTAKLLKPYAGLLEKAPQAPKSKKAPQNTVSVLSDDDLAAAAISAVRMHQQKNTGDQAGSYEVPLRGRSVRVQVASGSAPAAAVSAPAAHVVPAVGTFTEVKAPLPGTILRIEVAENDAVAAGDVLAVIESMKMETEIRAESAGTIRQIVAAAQDVLAADQTILLMETTK